MGDMILAIVEARPAVEGSSYELSPAIHPTNLESCDLPIWCFPGHFQLLLHRNADH